MKKLLVIILALATLCVLFTGCSNDTPSTTPATSNPPSTTEPTPPTPAPSEKPTPNPPATTGTGTAEDPADISTMPDTLPDQDSWWKLGTYGYDPQIIKQVSGTAFDITIAIPEVPEKLTNFCKDNGYSYYTIYFQSKTDDTHEIWLTVYDTTAIIRYFTFGFDTYRPSDVTEVTGPEDSPIGRFFTSNMQVLNQYMTFAGHGNGSLISSEIFPENADPFTATSYTLRDEVIDKFINAIN